MESTPALQTPDDRALHPTTCLPPGRPKLWLARMSRSASRLDSNRQWCFPVDSIRCLQTDRTKMGGVYDSMAATFVQSGLNLESITAVRQLYGNLDTQPEPLYYEHFPTPLQPGAVRLVVLQPEPSDPFIKLASDACQDVMRSMPSGDSWRIPTYSNFQDTCEKTVFGLCSFLGVFVCTKHVTGMGKSTGCRFFCAA